MALSVLMIDAEQPFANDIAKQLGEHSMQIEVIADGKQGLEKARKADDKPDLIVLCVELPKMSGYSICNKLKKDDSLREIPLIITSSEATPETFEQHKRLKTRADGYLIKPFAQEQILEEIHNLIPEAKEDDDESILDLGEDSADDGFDLSGFTDDMDVDDDFGSLDVDDDDISIDDIEEVDDDAFSLDEVADDDALSALGEAAVDGLGDLDVEESNDDDDDADSSNLLDALEDVAPLALDESDEPEVQADEEQEEQKEPADASPAPASNSAAKAEHDKQLREVRHQNSDLQARVAELETRLKAAEEDARKKTENLSTVQSSSSNNQREVLDLKQKLHEKEKELFTLKEESFSQEKAAFDASEKLTEVQRKSDEIVAEMADRDAKIATLESKVSTITEERNNIEQESQQRIGELENEVESLKQERDSIKSDGEKTQKRLETKLAAAEKLASDRGERVETLSSELADKESQIADLYQKSQHDQDVRERAFKAVEIASSLLAGDVQTDEDSIAADMPA